ncbi:MAG: hypothetical protein COA43_08965 [Robiginitomaculum sp.]|nr:MAG: hypothetical protein COA43_08965 [Robiginitomaculum sp.]
MKTLSSLCVTALASGLLFSACADKKSTENTETKMEMHSHDSMSALEIALDSDLRGEQKLRDGFRHPKETLEFFGLAAGQNVIEIYPGGAGWYTNILAPFIKENGGTYTAAGVNDTFRETFSDVEKYGDVKIVEFGGTSGALAAGDADLVLTFRNVHNWVGRGFADKAFVDFYAALKPGGILGVVEHRLPESEEQDLNTRGGYVQVSYVKALAKEAGFEFVRASEVNANADDTADHPFGVWTLPPISRNAKRDEEMAADFDAAKYKAIGESDRFTIMFRKPK